MITVPGPYLFAPYPGNPAMPFGPTVWLERLPDTVIHEDGYGVPIEGNLLLPLVVFALGCVLSKLEIPWGLLVG